jgi:hypothetical protein
VGEAANPLPPELLSELAEACAADPRIDVAYVFWLFVQLPGEIPHHCVGLFVDDRVNDSEFESLIGVLWTRIAALAPSDVPIDFQRFTDASDVPDPVPPFFTRRT